MSNKETFKIQVCESNTKIIDVQAESINEAFKKAGQMYIDGEILFTGDYGSGHEQSYIEAREYCGDPETTGQYRTI